MNKKRVEDIIINKVYTEFQKEHNISLPAIQQIKRISGTNSDANVISEQLYNKKYILNIDSQLMSKNDVQIYTKLYHEFTHIMDSILFLDYEYSSFVRIMNSYSETHASEIETKKRFFYSDDIVNQQSYIAINDILVTIEEYMQKGFGHVLNDFAKMSKATKNDMFFETNSLYYYIGRIKALKTCGVNFNFDYDKICQDFMMPCKKAYETLMSDNVDFRIVINDYISIEEAYKNCVVTNSIPPNIV